MSGSAADGRPRSAVFAPALNASVTIERGADDDEIHLHAGGQGFWIARLIVELGVDVTMVAPIGGEVGLVVSALAADAGVSLKAVGITGTNGAYVHDRRSGERQVVAEMPPTPLSRHDADELFGAALVEAIESDVFVVAGPGDTEVVPDELYERLVADARTNGVPVVADLSGPFLAAAVRGRVSVLKTSADDLIADGRLDADTLEAAVPCARALIGEGAGAVIVTRAEEGAILVDGEQTFAVEAPPVHAVEHRGAGDSLTARVAAGLARGRSLEEAVRIGAAAGGLNVTRRGLGSGSREEIERLAEHVSVHPLGS